MRLFCGSSGAYKSTAESVLYRVRDVTLEVRRWWTSEAFPYGQTTIESIENMAQWADAAILFLTPDDEIIQRGQRQMTARDNVIFEAGFFMSAFGRSRTALAVVGNLDVPTDLLGVTCLRMQEGDSETVLAANANRIRDWANALQEANLSSAQYLTVLATSALQRVHNALLGVSRLDTPTRDVPLRFPLAAYPSFLDELLNEDDLRLVAVEAVGSQQVASFRLLEEYASSGLRPFDHRMSHWYLWRFLPPLPQALDADKTSILAKTAQNAGVTRYMCIAPPERLPPLLFRAIYFYADQFVQRQPKAKLYFVVDEASANSANFMYIGLRRKWFHAERSADEAGPVVEIRAMLNAPDDPFESQLLWDAPKFTSRYAELYGRGRES